MKYLGMTGPNPCLVEKFPEKRHPRYVPPEQDFWKVHAQAKGQDHVMLLAYLHLAARRSEVFRMVWDDVDFENARVRLYTRKRRDGSLEYDWLPMTSALSETLLWWKENRIFEDSTHVFVCEQDGGFCQEQCGQPFRARIHLMARLCARAGVKEFGFHAIRHLTASTLYKMGEPVSVIQAILRHRSPNTTAIYLRSLGLEETRGALEGLATRFAGNGHAPNPGNGLGNGQGDSASKVLVFKKGTRKSTKAAEGSGPEFRVASGTTR
jgi:integrase